jgi:DNA-binding protein Fis
MGLAGHEELCGRTVKQIFGVNMSVLEGLGRGASSARPLPRTTRGSLCFGIMQPQRAPVSDLNALRVAERDALREIMDRCHWNVTVAAVQLDMNRRTLHRKLKSHGLHRYAIWNASIDA